MNPVKKTVKCELNGTTFELVWDFNAIAEVEDATGLSLLFGLIDGKDTRQISFVRACFLAAAHARHPSLTLNDVNKLIIDNDTYVKALVSIAEAYTQSTPKQEEVLEEANPTQGQS